MRAQTCSVTSAALIRRRAIAAEISVRSCKAKSSLIAHTFQRCPEACGIVIEIDLAVEVKHGAVRTRDFVCQFGGTALVDREILQLIGDLPNEFR